MEFNGFLKNRLMIITQSMKFKSLCEGGDGVVIEIKTMWKSLVAPIYDWCGLLAPDEKWADWSVMFLLGLIMVELVVM